MAAVAAAFGSFSVVSSAGRGSHERRCRGRSGSEGAYCSGCTWRRTDCWASGFRYNYGGTSSRSKD